MTDNEYGVEFDEIIVRKVRFHRTDGRWLVEYKRAPRWFLGIDALWWWNDGSYIEYHDAITRVNEIRAMGMVRKVRFQKTQTYEIE